MQMDEKSCDYVIAVDLGTSGPKVALYSTRGELVAYEFSEVSLDILPGGGAEQDPRHWWQAICDNMQRLLGQNLVPREKIAAVCCTAQWSGTVAVDCMGKPLMDAIIWMDTRGRSHVAKICDGWFKIHGYSAAKLLRWLRVSGGAPGDSGKDPVSHILYIKNERPDVYERTHCFLEPKDYLNLCFTGKCAAGTDSIALYWLADIRDVNNVVYDKKLVKISGIDPKKLPPLLRAVDVLGNIKKELACEWGLREDVKVVMGTPDVHSAVVGSGAVKDYEGHLYLGTSSWISCHVPFKKVDIVNRMSALPSPIPGRYLIANEQESAGACLKFLKNNIFYHGDELFAGNAPKDIYRLFDQIASQVKAGSGRLIFTPWLNGERAPIEDCELRSMFFNQSLKTTRKHMIRAVLEGVAYNSRWLLCAVEKFIGRRMDSLNVVGGGANSDLWCQIFADIFNRTIRQVKDPLLANSRGAAFLASAALDYIRFEDIGDYTQVKREYYPNPEYRKLYDRLFHAYLEIYHTNKKLFARLNRD